MQLKNDQLEVRINAVGAELKSVIMQGTERIWQADPAYWNRSAPVLFPVVGKPFHEELLIDGKSYPMPQHGFARNQQFEITEQSDTHSVFRLHADAQTKAQYPYDFALELSYRLDGATLHCGYKVYNYGAAPMYFSIGAHPGFNLPSGKMSDYVIAFGHEEDAERFLLSDGLLDGRTEPVLHRSKEIALSTAWFDKDALVFKHLRSQKVMLRDRHSDFGVTVAWDNFPYLGIWSKKGCERYVCIEPWCGIAGSTGGQVPIEEKEGINALQPGGTWTRSYSITFHA